MDYTVPNSMLQCIQLLFSAEPNTCDKRGTMYNKYILWGFYIKFSMKKRDCVMVSVMPSISKVLRSSECQQKSYFNGYTVYQRAFNKSFSSQDMKNIICCKLSAQIILETVVIQKWIQFLADACQMSVLSTEVKEYQLQIK